MEINKPEIIKEKDQTKIQSLILYNGKTEVLWFSVPNKFASGLTSERLDGFLVALLPLAMKLGENIKVNGCVSKRLFFNLSNYMVILNSVHPYMKKVKIEAEELSSVGLDSEGGVACGFSAGVDSFSALYEHYFNEKIDDYRITHLVFNNVGSHSDFDTEVGSKLFNSRYNLIKGFPEKLGVDFLKIDSNLGHFLNWSFMETHTSRNISALLMLQKLFSKYYYSSGLKYSDCIIQPGNDIAVADPASVHLLSTEVLECISTGCEFSRIQKTVNMIKVPDAGKWLNVCMSPDVDDGKNCSVCPKCCRTLLTLELLGVIDNFKDVFDLEKWGRAKKGYVIVGLNSLSKDKYFREIVDFAPAVNYRFKKSDVFASKVLGLVKRLGLKRFG